MPKVINYLITGKRPADATLEKVLDLRAAGLTQAEIARLWNISRQRVGQLIAKALKGKQQ